MSVLLGTQEITRAADFEVAHGDFKACAEFGELFHRLQAFFRRFRQNFVRTVKEIRKRHMVRTADASAHLIKLREAEMIGVINDDRVRIGNVKSVFDNTRREQDVIASLIKVHHDVFEQIFRHLPVRRLNPCIGEKSLQMIAHAVDRLDAVVNKIHLSAALHFALDRARDNGIVVFNDIRLNGETFRRRRFNDTHVTRADQ